MSRTDLESGAIVVSEPVAGVESVALGIYFPTGSRHETPSSNGISHFIEHLVFKGTARRSADEINREIDRLGGASNAYTSKETICLHARVLAEDLPRLFDLFGDLLTCGLPEGIEGEVERERAVILSEVQGVEDSPEDLLGEVSDAAFFGPHALGLPVVGSANAVRRLSLPEIRRHFRERLVARDMVIAAAGQLDPGRIVALVREHLGGLSAGAERAVDVPPSHVPSCRVLERDLEQVHVSLVAPGLAGNDPRWAVLELLSLIVGDGCSSRLFREVRDRRGLVYAIHSSPVSYTDVGTIDIGFSVAPEKLDETLDVVAGVLAAVRDGDVRNDELEAARQHLRGSLRLGYESTAARMSYLAEQVLFGEDDLEIARDLDTIAAVTLADVHALAAELLAAPLTLAAVGPVDSKRFPSRGGWLPR